jgi:hypothetical protein
MVPERVGSPETGIGSASLIQAGHLILSDIRRSIWNTQSAGGGVGKSLGAQKRARHSDRLYTRSTGCCRFARFLALGLVIEGPQHQGNRRFPVRSMVWRETLGRGASQTAPLASCR